jgi:hypothetical protein
VLLGSKAPPVSVCKGIVDMIIVANFSSNNCSAVLWQDRLEDPLLHYFVLSEVCEWLGTHPCNNHENRIFVRSCLQALFAQVQFVNMR